jgi:hypothetical protein
MSRSPMNEAADKDTIMKRQSDGKFGNEDHFNPSQLTWSWKQTLSDSALEIQSRTRAMRPGFREV